MSARKDPLSLLEQLKQQYGVDESTGLFGPSITVPNKDFKREWSQALSQAGYHMYVGEREGRVAWIIPLKARHNILGFVGYFVGDFSDLPSLTFPFLFLFWSWLAHGER